MTPDEERPGVHVPGPSLSRLCELDTVEVTPDVCAVCRVARAEAMHLTSALCGPCWSRWWDGMRLRHPEHARPCQGFECRVCASERERRERTVGVGRELHPADGWPFPWMWLRCDRCPRKWVGVEWEVCSACARWRGDSAHDGTRR